jgi:maleylacetoacetate isomerase
MGVGPADPATATAPLSRRSGGRGDAIGMRGLQGFEAMLDDTSGPYCHGDRVTLADLCLVPQAYNARRWGVDLAAFPRIDAIVATLEALPPVQAAHPDRVAPNAAPP